MSPSQVLMLDAAEAAGAKGITVAEFAAARNATADTIHNSLARMRREGIVLHVLNRGTQGNLYFTRPEWRDAAQVQWDAHVKAVAKACNTRSRAAHDARVAAASPKLHKVGAAVPGARNRDGKLSTVYQQTATRFRSPGAVVSVAQPVDYSRAKVTVCPSVGYDPRYQLPPGERIVGGFASAGIGRYLDGQA